MNNKEDSMSLFERVLNKTNETDKNKFTKARFMAFNEMATVVTNQNYNFRIAIFPDTNRNDAYFKVCNHVDYTKSTHVIRLSFFEAKYFDHKGDGKKLWKMNNREFKTLITCLKSQPYKKFDFKTNWDLAIFLWNENCNFINHPDFNDELPKGCSDDSLLLQEPQYVPLNMSIPDYTKIVFK